MGAEVKKKLQAERHNGVPDAKSEEFVLVEFCAFFASSHG